MAEQGLGRSQICTIRTKQTGDNQAVDVDVTLCGGGTPRQMPTATFTIPSAITAEVAMAFINTLETERFPVRLKLSQLMDAWDVTTNVIAISTGRKFSAQTRTEIRSLEMLRAMHPKVPMDRFITAACKRVDRIMSELVGQSYINKAKCQEIIREASYLQFKSTVMAHGYREGWFL